MQYYAMSNSTRDSRVWPYAPRFYAIDKLVQYKCSKCGSSAKYPVGRFAIDLEGGSKYPDILLCGAYPLLIISQQVLKAWEHIEAKGYRNFPVEIRNIDSEKLARQTPIEYYSIEVDATCQLDLNAMGVEIEHECSECGNIRLSKPAWEIEKLIFKPDSIKGMDIFTTTVFPRKIFVVEGIVECACRNKLTNFEFVRAEESLKIFQDPINYHNFCK